jgi:hypothetical protein
MGTYSYRKEVNFEVVDDRQVGWKETIRAVEYNISQNGDLTFFHNEPSDSGNYSELKPFKSYAKGIWKKVEREKEDTN